MHKEPTTELRTHLPANFDLYAEELSQEIWYNKYRFGDEKNMSDTAARVVKGVYAKDDNKPAKQDAWHAISMGLWMPGGRILAGAGTDKHVTLFNCYVNETLHDSMEGIHRGYGNVMFTMQQGGGIGTDFTPIRPDGAWLSRTQAPASGPIPFAIAQDSIGQTVESAGERRGAQMGTLADFHPDLLKWIQVKQTAGTMTQFNLSILVSDAFMEAVAEDADWLLYHAVAPLQRDPQLQALDFWDEYTNCQAYVYAVHRARELWGIITRATYEFSEPGVIFIDRVNGLNNLYYREQIRCTNPCGEQPLPPDACCNLGANNLALMVKNPFTADAEFDFDLLRRVTWIGQRFLDNVTDVTNYPLERQQLEQFSTRRTGLGFTALASAMAQLGIRYGSGKSARFAAEVTRTMAYASYEASQFLAAERGAFPEYDEAKYWHESDGFAARTWKDTPLFGKPMRNGVLNTIAPVGTGSIAFGNIDSSLEPIFQLEYNRKVRQRDDTYKVSRTRSFTKRLWEHLHGQEEMPKHVTEATAMQLKVHEHVLVQEACQQFIDASISKTINVPKDMPYEDFVKVYELAYESGLKGCTTYRPSEVRGSILVADTVAEQKQSAMAVVAKALNSRPKSLQSITTKISWPALNSAAYVTLGRDDEGQPFEVFLNSKDQRNNEWMTTATLFMSWLLRSGVPLSKIASEMEQVHSIDGYLVEGRYRPSLVSYLGQTLREMEEQFNASLSDSPEEAEAADGRADPKTGQPVFAVGKRCRQCNSPQVVVESGCEKCVDCGHSKCA